ncbi:MAG: hypothetical protein RBQ86_06835 [Candidatus Izemoplasmatales bacterium]|nr:hypothetical protein [Candidatus Izemoplasmatales bacterium]
MRSKMESNVPELILNDKILDALSWIALDEDITAEKDFIPETRLFIMEGTIRSAKTVTAVIGFAKRVKKQKGKFALIAAKDFDAINDNILNAELGLFSLFPDDFRLKRDKIGGYYLEVVGTEKRILLVGYSDVAKWKKILGKDLETILIDEINIADELFIKECFARQAATTHPILIGTLNGDDPNHVIYRERINKCLILGNAPASIVAEMNAERKKKRGYYYTHWTFDDNPKLTVKQKARLRVEYPTGSFYHKTRILGERGKWGKMIFADYMSPDLIVNINAVDDKGKSKYPIERYTIGMDIAENRATNVIALLGFDKDFRWVVLVDLEVFKSEQNGRSVGYAYKTQMLRAFLERHSNILNKIDGAFIDSAEGNYISDLQAERLPIAIAACYKATIKERIDLNIILFNGKRFLFDVKCIAAYNAFMAATWVPGKEGKEREDNNLPMNDIMDATEYGETRHMNKLLNAAKKGVA